MFRKPGEMNSSMSSNYTVTSGSINFNKNLNNSNNKIKNKIPASFTTDSNPFIRHNPSNFKIKEPVSKQPPPTNKPQKVSTVTRQPTPVKSPLPQSLNNLKFPDQPQNSGSSHRPPAYPMSHSLSYVDIPEKGSKKSNKTLSMEKLENRSIFSGDNVSLNSTSISKQFQNKLKIHTTPKQDTFTTDQNPFVSQPKKSLNTPTPKQQPDKISFQSNYSKNLVSSNIYRSKTSVSSKSHEGLSPFSMDTTKRSIDFMVATPEPFQNRLSNYFKNKLSRFHILLFIFFLTTVIVVLVSLVSPYWLVMREPWIERALVPKQFQIDPEKHNAFVGLYSSCNTENHCAQGTPYNDRGWYKGCQVLFAIGFSFLLGAFVVDCAYLCCTAYISIPSYKLIYIVALVVLAGAVLLSICLGIFGSTCLNQGLLTPLSLNGPGGQLAWAFVLGIIGAAFSLVLSILLLIDAVFQSKKLSV